MWGAPGPAVLSVPACGEALVGLGMCEVRVDQTDAARVGRVLIDRLESLPRTIVAHLSGVRAEAEVG